MLTRQPNVVLTARGDNPSVENTLVNDVMSCILGLSSATTIHVRTLDKFTPFCYNKRGNEIQSVVLNNIINSSRPRNQEWKR